MSQNKYVGRHRGPLSIDSIVTMGKGVVSVVVFVATVAAMVMS